MRTTPYFVDALFIFTLLLTVFLFWKAAPHKRLAGFILLLWLLLQSALSLKGFYRNTTSIPPHFLLLTLPPFITIVGLLVARNGRNFIFRADARMLTLLHTVRVPVEIVLYQLFLYKLVPQLMTFEGRNFDILAGVTAPFVYYFGYKKAVLGKRILLLWNVVCLLSLLNIVTNAILSTPSPIQQFAFSQPNIAILSFPFTLLPGCIVPLVLLSHIACMYQLGVQKPKEPVR